MHISIGLLNKTTSVLGKQMLAEWVSKPTRDKEVLDYRHEAIRFFLQSDMRDAIQEFSNNLKHVKNIHRLLAKVKESKSKSNDWQHILKVFVYYCCYI
jgi:DNA mismatch repair protein MSH5